MSRRAALCVALAAMALAALAACSGPTTPSPSAPASPSSPAATSDSSLVGCPTGVHELAKPGDLGDPCYFVSGTLVSSQGDPVPSGTVIRAVWIGGPQPAATLLDAAIDSSGNFTLSLNHGARYMLELPGRSTATVTQASGGSTLQSAVISALSGARAYYTLAIPADQTLPAVLGTAVVYGLTVKVAPAPTLIPNALQAGVDQGVGVRYDPANIARLRVRAAQTASGGNFSLFEFVYLALGVCGAAVFGLFAMSLGSLLVDPRYRSSGATKK